MVPPKAPTPQLYEGERWVRIVISLCFAIGSVCMILMGQCIGWLGLCIFGPAACLEVFEPWLPKRTPRSRYAVHADTQAVTIRHPRSKSETFDWTDIDRVVLGTSSDGPWLPDKWLFFVDCAGKEYSVPWEADGFTELMSFLKEKFPGFDFSPFIHADTTVAAYECWQRHA